MRSHEHQTRRARPVGVNALFALRLVLLVQALALIAFLCGPTHFWTLFSTFLLFASIVRGTTAALLQEPLWGDHLNRWDEAAMLIGSGVLVHLLQTAALAIQATSFRDPTLPF